jgi:hypothetical protein
MSSANAMSSENAMSSANTMSSKETKIINESTESHVEPDTKIEDPDTKIEDPEDKTEEPLKKYRARSYDDFDKKYAIKMKNYDIPQEFRDFTCGLMEETHINRFGLLQAIEDYEQTKPEKELSSAFTDNAFNYRPYQPCIIS